MEICVFWINSNPSPSKVWGFIEEVFFGALKQVIHTRKRNEMESEEKYT